MKELTALSVVAGDRTNPRDAGRRRLEHDEQVTCWACRADTGVETSAVVEVVQAPRRSAEGKKRGGRKSWACAHCLSRGKVTELIRF